MTNTPIGPGIENSLGARRHRQELGDPQPHGEPRSRTTSPAIESKSALEGGGSTPRVTILATAPIVSFNGLGAATAGIGTIAIENPPAGACVLAGGPVRCWNIVVAPGGQVRLCDPAASVGDTRSCTP